MTVHLSSQFLLSLIPLVLSIAFTMLVCLFAQPLGRALGLLDEPSGKLHSRHDRPTPLVGGMAVLVPVIVLGFMAPLLLGTLGRDGYWVLAPQFAASVAVMLILGMIDDRYHLSARMRLFVSGATFFALILFNPVFVVGEFVIPLFDGSIKVVLGSLAVAFSALCLVALANAINMADGRNGLVVGMSMIWTIAFVWLTPVAYPGGLLTLLSSLAVVFACNMRGRLFLGDGGTYGLAAVFGLTAIWMHNLPESAISEAQIAALFLIPVLDMVRLMQARARRGRAIMAADHDHLHHYLDDWIGWRRGLPLYLGVMLVPILISLLNPYWSGEALLLGVVLYWLVLRTAQQGRQQTQQHGQADAAVLLSAKEKYHS